MGDLFDDPGHSFLGRGGGLRFDGGDDSLMTIQALSHDISYFEGRIQLERLYESRPAGSERVRRGLDRL